MTYKDIVKIFKSFAVQHPDINKFKFDTVDRLNDFSNQDEVFPMLYIAPISSFPQVYDSGYKATLYSFRAFCLVTRVDLEDIDEDNKVDLNQTTNNLEQCAMILQHFNLYLNNMFDEVSVNLNPLNDYGIDRLQGWSADFDIEVANNECFKFEEEE